MKRLITTLIFVLSAACFRADKKPYEEKEPSNSVIKIDLSMQNIVLSANAMFFFCLYYFLSITQKELLYKDYNNRLALLKLSVPMLTDDKNKSELEKKKGLTPAVSTVQPTQEPAPSPGPVITVYEPTQKNITEPLPQLVRRYSDLAADISQSTGNDPVLQEISQEEINLRSELDKNKEEIRNQAFKLQLAISEMIKRNNDNKMITVEDELKEKLDELRKLRDTKDCFTDREITALKRSTKEVFDYVYTHSFSFLANDYENGYETAGEFINDNDDNDDPSAGWVEQE